MPTYNYFCNNSSGRKLWVFPRFAGDCASGHRKSHSGSSSEQKFDITDTCSQMILQLHDVYDPNKVSPIYIFLYVQSTFVLHPCFSSCFCFADKCQDKNCFWITLWCSGCGGQESSSQLGCTRQVILFISFLFHFQMQIIYLRF